MEPHGVGETMVMVALVMEHQQPNHLQFLLLVALLIGVGLLQDTATLKVFEAKQISHKYKIRI
jgi:hypothetical protein